MNNNFILSYSKFLESINNTNTIHIISPDVNYTLFLELLPNNNFNIIDEHIDFINSFQYVTNSGALNIENISLNSNSNAVNFKIELMNSIKIKDLFHNITDENYEWQSVGSFDFMKSASGLGYSNTELGELSISEYINQTNQKITLEIEMYFKYKAYLENVKIDDVIFDNTSNSIDISNSNSHPLIFVSINGYPFNSTQDRKINNITLCKDVVPEYLATDKFISWYNQVHNNK